MVGGECLSSQHKRPDPQRMSQDIVDSHWRWAMDLGRFLVEAVVVREASPTELARSHPISRSWLFRLLARYKQGGYEALEPSRTTCACASELPPRGQPSGGSSSPTA